MLVDRRTLILQELESLLGGLTITLSNGAINPGNFVRNRNDLPKEKVPGVLLLDGDEVPTGPAVPTGRNVPVTARLMRMQPEIYVVLDVRRPTNLNVGEDLTIARQVIIPAILEDQTLQAIVGSNGQISYEGIVTDLARNRMMEGQMGIAFSFVYPFIPKEIAGLA